MYKGQAVVETKTTTADKRRTGRRRRTSTAVWLTIDSAASPVPSAARGAPEGKVRVKGYGWGQTKMRIRSRVTVPKDEAAKIFSALKTS